LKEWETLADQLIKEFSRENSFTLGGPIKIEIIFDETMDEKLQISTHQSILTSGDTISLSLGISDKSEKNNGLHAYLILWDEEYFKITKNVTNIGRQEENNLVIDNLRVSRVHAQIRRNSKGFNIIDSNSTSGTKVNGHLIDKHQLSNGDVIEIADVPLIFNMDEKHDLNTTTKLLNIKKDEWEDV